MNATRIAVVGLGEAGRLMAAGLAGAGADVVGFDPVAGDAGVPRADSIAAAVEGADVVLSLVGASAAPAVAADVVPALGDGAVFADLNTATPEVKRRIGAANACFADVAVLAPVPRAGHRTPLIASGPAAARFAERVRPFGADVTVLDAPVGAAASLKLLRSVFMKGLAALVIESVTAARDAGAEEWLRAQVAAELGPDGQVLVERLIGGTFAHAERREHEVRDALAALEAAGQPSDMTRATLAWFERITAGDAALRPPPEDG